MTSFVLIFIALALSLSAPLRAEDILKKNLHMSSPDGAQKEGVSSSGILVFDIENGHKFVKRIEIPIFKEGLRGFTGSVNEIHFDGTGKVAAMGNEFGLGRASTN